MAALIHAKLELPQGASAPDPWNQGEGIALRLDAVIARNELGHPISCVGDFVWDWTYYTPRKRKSPLIFFFWKSGGNQKVHEVEITKQRVALMRELQYLMVLRIYYAERLIGFGALRQDLFCLRGFARFAFDKRCSVRDVLEQSSLLDQFIETVPPSISGRVLTWLKFLSTRDPVTELGFEVAKPKKIGELRRREKQYRDNNLQTAPLPTRIYLGLINALAHQLDDIEAHQVRLTAALREAILLHRQHMEKGLTIRPQFGPELVEKHDLAEFMVSRGGEADLGGLTSALTNVFRVCKTQIHTFSGMRHEEAQHLPYHCMETVKAGHGREHSLIVGVTTKLAGARRKRTRWVTTDAQGFRAIRLAQAFASIIYESLGVTPSTDDSSKDNFPLFVGSSYLPWLGTQEISPGTQLAPGTGLHINKLPDALKLTLFPVIEASDIDELEAIDPFRDWMGEAEFAIGQPWSLTSHQLRRSLALYANASGLVRIASLRRQLQHITREMSEYYGRGSAFAKNFLAEDSVEFKKHICFEWPDSEQEAQYLAFTRDVLHSDEPLCGPGGRFFDLQKQRGDVMAPQEVKDQLKMGRMAYKAHPLGGCTHLGTCDKQKGLRLTSGICISENCKSLVGKHSSILKLIPIQREIVSRIDPDSIAFHMEKEELDILEAAEVQWQPANRALTALPGVANV